MLKARKAGANDEELFKVSIKKSVSKKFRLLVDICQQQCLDYAEQ